mgnify:CR=1 FL=1
MSLPRKSYWVFLAPKQITGSSKITNSQKNNSLGNQISDFITTEKLLSMIALLLKSKFHMIILDEPMSDATQPADGYFAW